MHKDVIKQIIVENHDLIENLELFYRNENIESEGNYVFTGPRRAGKTYTMYEQIKSIFSKEKELSSVLYINFEDERLTEFKSEHFQILLEAHAELFDSKPILYLDEIQNIEGWEKFARRLADSKYRVFITGSNAQMLSNEIATTLGGRFIIKEILPFSFLEHLRINKIDVQKNWEYSSVRFEIRKSFNNYFYYGGFPELNMFSEKRIWLQNLYKKIFYGDLITRYKIRNDFALRLMIKKIAESLHDEISFNRIKHIIQSAGVKIGTATVIEYSKFLEETWLLFKVKNYLAKVKDKETSGKFYFIDNGILSLFLVNAETILLENIVATGLRRKYDDNFYYLKKNIEVDFYIPDEEIIIQVAYNINNSETERREISSLLKIQKLVPVKRMIIITLDTEKTIIEKDTEIKVISVWKWLLNFSFD